MPKSKPSVIPGDGAESLSAVDCALVTADALYRAALDTWHHHERLSRLVDNVLAQPAVTTIDRVLNNPTAEDQWRQWLG